MNAGEMTKIYNGIRYDTTKAELIAHDCYSDGRNMERHGRNKFLYKTKKGIFFLLTRTMWMGERDDLTPVTQEEAIQLYEVSLPEHEIDYEVAFPDAIVEDA